MVNSHFVASLLVSAFFFLPLLHGGLAITAGTPDGSEQWGYVEVRPKAHMFWWYYKSPYRTEDPNKPWPIILWLQGGPGASGVAFGNFEEIGPLDGSLKPRESTWLKKADILFVDNPVGTGFSYVEDNELFVKTDEESASDLTALLIEIFNSNEALQKSPLYIVAESYGGKFAVTLGLSALKAIEAKKLKLILGGVVLGDTWISPLDFVASWGPLLKDVGRIDDNGLKKAKSYVRKIKQLITDGRWEDATYAWGNLELAISKSSNSVDFYNFMLDSSLDPLAVTAVATDLSQGIAMKTSSRYSRERRSLRATPGVDDDLEVLMNGPIRKKLGVIPDNIEFGKQQGDVFNYLLGEFMKPRINNVDELLSKGVNVTIYTGQVDLICSTKGTQAWVGWAFLNLDRTPLYCGDDKETRGFFKSYKKLYFYWFLKAGHYVPVDQPCVALDMVANVTHSPA